jgi:hypothetical protein
MNMARAVLYAGDGSILQITEGAAENIAATADARGVGQLEIPTGPLYRDFFLDSTHKVVAGAIVEG